jgi:hypothetical protein
MAAVVVHPVGTAPTAAAVVVRIYRMEATAFMAALVLLVIKEPVEPLLMAGQVVVALRAEPAPLGGPVALATPTVKTAAVAVVIPLAAVRLPLVA